MAPLIQDFRYGLRMLRRNPSFTIIAALTLALGIGANTAIFSAINALFLHPPGIPHPERLVTLRVKYDKLGLPSIVVSAPDFARVRDSKQVFDAAAMLDQADLNYASDQGPQRLLGALVSAQWFEVFSAKPLLGRAFAPEEDQPGANHEAVLAYAAWKRLFGGDSNIIGRTVWLNEQSYKITGVMGPDFRWPSDADLWVPLGLAPREFAAENRYNENYYVVARLKPQITFAQSQSFVQLLTQQDIQHDPQGNYAKDSGWGMFVVPMTDYVFGNVQKPLRILLGAVGLVLLIACANVAGLLLAKASGRSKEFAVRAALGASRAALVRQALTEGFLLATAGTGLGILFAVAGIHGLVALAPATLASGAAIPIDTYVVLFTAAVGVLAAFVFGVFPAWQASRIDPNQALKETSWSGVSRSRQRLRSLLVTTEVALALVLLAGAGLLLKSLSRLAEVNPGFQPKGVLTAALALPERKYDTPAKQIEFFRAVLDQLSHAPGVKAAGAGFPLPFSSGNATASFSIEDRPELPGDPGPHSAMRYVTPGYFSALQIPLVRGRLFTDEDRLGTQPVAVIDENLARAYWPNQDPVGKHIRRGSQAPWATIVGIVGHIRFNQLAGEEQSTEGEISGSKGAIYFPNYQTLAPFGFLIARAAGDGDPSALDATIREAVRSIDPNQAVHDLKTMQGRVQLSLAPQRFAVTLLGMFAGMAVVLSAVGLYGLLSFTVAQRTHEIGIRVALGAEPRNVLALIIRQGMTTVAAGVAVGLVVAVAFSRLIATLLYDVRPSDPVTYLLVTGLLALTALLACLIPAWRATRVDPMIALRYE